LNRLKSIEEIRKVFQTTGSYPVLVHCDDLEDYVCKYDIKNKLVNEFLAAQFLEIWNIPVPPCTIIDILPEHIPHHILGNRIQRQMFTKPCFGSCYLTFAQDITELTVTMENSRTDINKIINRSDLLKIALFDIWLANNDRNQNNHNLLLNPTETGNIITAIDHTEIFDGGRLGFEMGQLTENDSILFSNAATVLLSGNLKISEKVRNLKEEFYICVAECGSKLTEIVEALPNEWVLDKNETREAIQRSVIDNQEWLKECERNFIEFVQLAKLI
jgi:hypothetical protein